nr:xylulose kinase-1 [Tanacetum cinerariifolium]
LDLQMPLEEIKVDDKLYFMEEPVEIVDRQVKKLKQSWIPIVKASVTAVSLKVYAICSIKYALTMNPNIYVSCIKQFWTTVAVKNVNDVIRLQALVDKKKVVVTKVTIRDALRLDDAEGVDCLPNEEIFAELARIGYEKPSTKLTFYKAFFSSQKQVGDLSTHTIKYTSPALTQKVFANIRIVGKGFSGIETPLFKGMLVAQEVGEGGVDVEHDERVPAAGVVTKGDVSAAHDEVPTADEEPSIPSISRYPLPSPQVQLQSPQVQPQSPQPQPPPTQDAEIHMNLFQEVMNTCTTLSRRVEHLELDKIAQALEITKLKRMVKKLERRNKVKVLKLRRLQ